MSDIGLIIDTLKDVHSITTIYARFDQVNENCKLVGGKLFYGDKEVALVYYRYGYDSDQYTSDEHWKAREILEISQAVKCPSVDLQLLTFKKIQEVLGGESVWEEFNGKFCDDIKPFFKDVFLPREEWDDAKVNYKNYVLKTQREGGGHNYFGEKIRDQLEKNDELWMYSLMKRVFPIRFPANLLRNNQLWSGEAVSELGVFGKILVKFDSPNTLLANEEIGCMMRTKPHDTDEGGVNAGYAFVDSPYLAEDDELQKPLSSK